VAQVPYRLHLLVCQNQRPLGHPRGDCAGKGAAAVLSALKAGAKATGASGVRVNGSGCLDTCELGVSIVAYPDAVWYGNVADSDVPEIVAQHVVGGCPVERLRIEGETRG